MDINIQFRGSNLPFENQSVLFCIGSEGSGGGLVLQADEEEMFVCGCVTVLQLCFVYVWGSSCFGCPGVRG